MVVPNASSSSVQKQTNIAIGCIAAVFLMFLCKGCFSTDPQATTSAAGTRDSVEMCAHAVIASHRTVEACLKCPSTAKFENAYDVGVAASGSTYSFVTYVDSQNGFGAMIRTPYACEMKQDGPGEWDFTVSYLKLDDVVVIGDTPVVTPGAASSSPTNKPADVYVPPPSMEEPTSDTGSQQQCSTCKGNRLCGHCGGAGCSFCNRTGKCPTCKGSGKVSAADKMIEDMNKQAAEEIARQTAEMDRQMREMQKNGQ